jgi:multidrug resistance efflux pump
MRINIYTLAVIGLIALGSPAIGQDITLNNCVVGLLDDAKVPAQESGILVSVPVRDGQPVVKDEVIARIDDTLAILQKKVSEAELGVAKKKLENDISIRYAKVASNVTRRNYERLFESNKIVKNSVPEADLEIAWLEYDEKTKMIEKAQFETEIAKEEMHVAEANLAAAQEHIHRREVKAPWDGVVDQVVRHEGDWVEPGDPVLRLLRMDFLRVESSVSTSKYNPEDIFHRPATITIRRAGDKIETFKGRVGGIIPRSESDDRYPIWIEVQNRKQGPFWLLHEGMRADVVIHAGSPAINNN